MMNDPMTENRELDLWREQWSGVTRPSSEFQCQVRKRIKSQNRRFWLGNVLAVVAFLGMLIYAAFLGRQANRLERSEAAGVCVLVLVAIACRLWLMRGTWRADTQSIRAFVELRHRRVLSQIRRLRISIYIAIGWLMFCVVLAAANSKTIGLAVRTHPIACLELMVIIGIMLPVIWLGAMGLRRRKTAELSQVARLLEQMND